MIRANALRDTLQDLRYAMRALARSRSLSAMIVVTLGLGVGANAAMFAFMDRVFLRPPAGVASPGRIHRVYRTQSQRMIGGSFTTPALSYPHFAAFESAGRDAGRVALYELRKAKVRIGDAVPRELPVVYATADYFTLLGVRLAGGRSFTPDEAALEGAERVAVISDALWHAAFGATRAAIGAHLDIDGERFTVIGIAPRAFTGVDLDAVALWLPLGARPTPSWVRGPWYKSGNVQGLEMLIRPRATAVLGGFEARATVELRRLNGSRFIDTTSFVSTSGLLRARGPSQQPGELRVSLRVAGVTAIVLLIACANVGNLLLARAVSRRHEIAVRRALGISNGRLVRLLLAEGLLLALASAIVALLAAAWGGMALRRVLLPNVVWEGGALDARVALFTIAVAMVAGVGASLGPALAASRAMVSDALKSGVRDGFGRRARLRSALVIAQTALSLILLVGAGLFIRSVRAVNAIDVGWDSDRLVLASVSYPETMRVTADPAAMHALADRARRLPGVESVALTSLTPMSGISFLKLAVPGRDSMPMNAAGPPTVVGVAPELFATAGLRLRRGRVFTREEAVAGTWGIVVNETMATAVWPDDDVLSKCIILGKAGACRRVVGVVEDAHRIDVVEAAPAMEFYVPIEAPGSEFQPWGLVVRVSPNRGPAVVGALRRDIAAAFPAGTPDVSAMSDRLAPQLRPWRLGATLFSAFGALALVVAAIGVYSAVSYGARQRTHEFGVRLALGARAVDVIRLVVGGGVRVVATGVLLGLMLSIAGGRVVASLLYGTTPHDPAVLAAIALTLLAVAGGASLAPAIRASRADPMEALRAE